MYDIIEAIKNKTSYRIKYNYGNSFYYASC